MKKTQLYVLTFILLVFSSMSLAQEDTWTRKADMPFARYTLCTSVVNGKIYAIGGTTGVEALSTVEEYDPATDTWTKRSDMPTARRSLSTSVVNGKIYAIGGVGAGNVFLATVEEYDPKTNTWTKKADMPTPRGGLSTSVVNGIIYAIGSRGNNWATTYSTVEAYDPATDTWTKKADMPTARRFLSTSVVNGKIYAIGGRLGQSAVEEYDPATDTWTKKADIPTARAALSTSAVNGKIYAIGGTPDNNIGLSTVEVYNPATDTWTRKADMPTLRYYFSTSVVNGKIYAIGGMERGWEPLVKVATVEAYDTGVGIRVTIISPQEGGVSGGEPIEIFGRQFPPDAVVTIGGKPLIDLEVTDTRIIGLIPPGTGGAQDVLITAPSIDFTVFAGMFIYTSPAEVLVTAMTPTSGPKDGGEMGVIMGSGFTRGATVLIGDTPATDVVVTPTRITFTIPSGAEGTVDVVVINPDGKQGVLRGEYTYTPLPIIGGTWTRKADMPTGRAWLSTAVVNGKIYAIGGYLGGTSVTSAVEAYDPVTDTWAKKTDMPTARDTLSTAVVNGEIYAIGGFIEATGEVLSTVEEYDPATDTWKKKADKPIPDCCFSTGVVNGKIYVIGEGSIVEEYDPATDTWTRKAGMPTPRGWLATNAPAVNGKIYAIGGWQRYQGPGVSSVDEYDPATDTWTKGADMPTPIRINLSLFCLMATGFQTFLNLTKRRRALLFALCSLLFAFHFQTLYNCPKP